MQLCSKVMECDWKKCQRNWFFFSIYTYLELLFLYFLYFIHSSFLLNICIQKIIHHFCSLYINHFQSYLSEEQKRILPKNLIEKKAGFGARKTFIYGWPFGHYFFFQKIPIKYRSMSIFHNTLVPLFSTVKMSLRKLAN